MNGYFGFNPRHAETVATGSPTSFGSEDEQNEGFRRGKGHEIISAGTDPEPECFSRSNRFDRGLSLFPSRRGPTARRKRRTAEAGQAA